MPQLMFKLTKGPNWNDIDTLEIQLEKFKDQFRILDIVWGYMV